MPLRNPNVFATSSAAAAPFVHTSAANLLQAFNVEAVRSHSHGESQDDCSYAHSPSQTIQKGTDLTLIA